MDYEKIGKYIAKCRKEIGDTQEELALKLGITAKAVSKWECGRGLPDISIMLDLCYILGINIISLLMGENSNTEYTIIRTGGNIYKSKKKLMSHRDYPNIGDLSKEKIIKLKDIKDDSKEITIEGEVTGFLIKEDSYVIRCRLELSDGSGKINVIFKDNQKIELKTLIRQVKIGDQYRIKGTPYHNEVLNENNFLVKTIQKLSS